MNDLEEGKEIWLRIFEAMCHINFSEGSISDLVKKTDEIYLKLRKDFSL